MGPLTPVDLAHHQPQPHDPTALNNVAFDHSESALNRKRKHMLPSQLINPDSDANPDGSYPMGSHQSLSSTLHNPAPQTLSVDRSGFGDVARFLARRELLTSSLTIFDDRPESYWSWKSSFLNCTKGTDLTCSEELDLLIKWLGPQSSAHVKRIRAVHVNDSARGLIMAWSRLQDCYGSPEMIEKALFDRVEQFPKILCSSESLAICYRS